LRGARGSGRPHKICDRPVATTSLTEPLTAPGALRAARGRWGIENRIITRRDATWLEDKTRTHTGHTAANLALLRGIVLIQWRRRHPRPLSTT
jgi:hypothetical protein